MLALEGTPVHLNSASGFSTTLSIGPFTTSKPAQLYVVATMNQNGLSSITGGGLTWTKRTGFLGTNSLEMWTAQAASSLSAITFTLTVAGSITFGTFDLFAFSGQNITTIFDSNASVPVFQVGDPITASTNNLNDVIIAGYRFSSTVSPTSGTGFTQISGADFQLTEYKIVSSPQVSLSCAIGTGAGNGNGSVVDAVMAMEKKSLINNLRPRAFAPGIAR